jgi:hypothetical protein
MREVVAGDEPAVPGGEAAPALGGSILVQPVPVPGQWTTDLTNRRRSSRVARVGDEVVGAHAEGGREGPDRSMSLDMLLVLVGS